jgi:hypothetical protein
VRSGFINIYPDWTPFEKGAISCLTCAGSAAATANSLQNRDRLLGILFNGEVFRFVAHPHNVLDSPIYSGPSGILRAFDFPLPRTDDFS